MKVECEYRVQSFMGSNVIIPAGKDIWNKKALLILDDCGLEIWTLLAKDTDLQEIAAHIMEKFNLGSEAADRRINGILKPLKWKGLLSE